MRRAVLSLVLYGALSVVLLLVLGTRMAGIPPLGALLDPLDGLYRTARQADAAPPEEFAIPGLQGDVEILWEQRGVPHIYAENDLDAIAALGYVVARDRLFQLDFLPRAASGRLSEALGGATVDIDRFLRRTGMEWGAQKNLARIREKGGEELEMFEAYCRGVNAYIDGLDAADLPFEFRLLGYLPDRCTPIQSLRVLQYMTYDLTYKTDEAAYGWLKQRLGEENYELLYPAEGDYFVPIIPHSFGAPVPAMTGASAGRLPAWIGRVLSAAFDNDLVEGYRFGKGSNNWAVAGSRSATGRPIIAGDMHLRVSLPAIWYEAHLVTPSINSYGVTIPGAPLPVEAFNDHLAWTFTNTGADQIDHLLLSLDSTGHRYRYEDGWREIESVPDTIYINGGAPVVDTLRYSHWGPITTQAGEAVALRWVAHDSSRTHLALLYMNRARSHDEFQRALRFWDTPMQNILFAGGNGNISIRSTGFFPIRRGGNGRGLLDGSSRDSEWIGRIPFDELPYSENPEQGFLTSTNQKPTDASYPYYLDHDWREGYRSIRIDSLLRGSSRHSVDDLKRYQSDVHAVQRDLLVPLLDTLSGVDGEADRVRRTLVAWDGEMTVDRMEPVLLSSILDELSSLTWDEDEFAPVYEIDASGDTISAPYRVPLPNETRVLALLSEHPTSRWLDVVGTPEREDAAALLRLVLKRVTSRHEDLEDLRWGDYRKIQFNYMISNPRFAKFGRGPFEYPGYEETLSPAGDPVSTHSASARLVVDFSTPSPRGWIVYPGGQSGNPFSRRYDLHLPTYLSFSHYDVLRPASPEGFGQSAPAWRSVAGPDPHIPSDRD